MVLSRQSKAKWRSTAVANFTPKKLGEPSAAHSEVSQMSMKSVFLAVDGRIPQLPGGENAVAFEDTRDGEQKKDLVEGAVTDRPHYQCMSHQDTHDTLIPMGHHPLSPRTDPHPSPLSTCLMRPRCCTSVACETIFCLGRLACRLPIGYFTSLAYVIVCKSTKYEGSNPNRATVGSSGHATGVP
jgi:hypothetical protein